MPSMSTAPYVGLRYNTSQAEVAERQTRRSQTPLRATSWGFKFPLRMPARLCALRLSSLQVGAVFLLPWEGHVLPCQERSLYGHALNGPGVCVMCVYTRAHWPDEIIPASSWLIQWAGRAWPIQGSA